ncbi:hypothetical protein GCM10009591_35650 [Brachybacterium tyrofermentans]
MGRILHQLHEIRASRVMDHPLDELTAEILLVSQLGDRELATASQLIQHVAHSHGQPAAVPVVLDDPGDSPVDRPDRRIDLGEAFRERIGGKRIA